MTKKYFDFIYKFRSGLSAVGLGLLLVIGVTAQEAAPAVTPSPEPTPEAAASPSPDAAPTPSWDSRGLPQSVPDVALGFAAEDRPLPSVERVGVEVDNQKPLSLNDAITLALQNSNDIETSQVDVKIAEYQLKGARGAYDPVFTTENYFRRSEMPTASSLGAVDGSTTTEGFVSDFTVSGQTPFAGGSYSANLRSSKETTNNPFNTLNPQFLTGLNFSYTQPLMRGLKTDNNRRQIAIAKKNLSLSDAQFRQRSIDVVTNVIAAYWDLTNSLRNLQVQTDAVKQARAQLESNRRRVAEGTIAPIEIVEAETQVTNFEQGVYTAQQAVTRAENTLKTLMLPSEKDPLWAHAIVPTTPVHIEPPTVTVEEALAEAKANRPELQQLQTSKEINDINTDFFKDQTKPRIDLVASYSSNGLAGTALEGSGGLTSAFGPVVDRLNLLSATQNLPPIEMSGGSSGPPPALVGGIGNSMSNAFGFNNPTYQVGVKIELPFGNRRAKADYGAALATGTKLDAQFAQQEQLIKADVQNSLQAMRAAEARLNAAAASRRSSEQLFESEQRKLDNGTTNVYMVFQRQQNLVNARGMELQAQTDLNKAISDFQRATGSTFQSHNIEVRDTSSNGMKTLEIKKPTEAGSDSAGWTPSNPRVAPPVGKPSIANAGGNE